MAKNQLLRLFLTFIFSIAAFSSSLAQEDLAAIVKKVQPSIIFIQTYDEEGEVIAQGSGFFVSEEGDVITNFHLVEGAKNAAIKTATGKVYLVKKVAAEDKEGDLARLSVDISRNEVRPLPISGSLPRVGERIMMISNPLGLEQKVTVGVVSTVREISGFGDIIQINIPLSRGSSGSPVVNMKGEAIGMVGFPLITEKDINLVIPGARLMGLIPGE
jgi:serine protease Do